MLGIYEGTDQELQALRILRSKPEIYEYLSWDAYTDTEVHVLKRAIFNIDHSVFGNPCM